MGKRRPNAGRKRRSETKARPPTFKGWLSTDEDEIRRREWRGRTEIESVQALDERFAPFGNYRVASSSGSAYVVEIRSLRERINSCECRDYRVNRLGTCKHIEGVRHHPDGIRAFPAKGREASGRIEVFLDGRSDRTLQMSVPSEVARRHPELVREAEAHYRRLRRGSRNLDELAERVSSIMLRRRKEDVEEQLPGRTSKTFFVPMTEVQLDIYGDYEYRVRRLAAQAERRPLTPEEFKMLHSIHNRRRRFPAKSGVIMESRTERSEGE